MKRMFEVVKFSFPVAIFLCALVSVSANSAEIVCGADSASKRRTYPINEAAIKLAAQLNVKTCTGTSSDRFKDAVKSGGHTGKFVVVSKEELEAAKKKLSALGGGTGPSWN